jgi:hypothetical protein
MRVTLVPSTGLVNLLRGKSKILNRELQVPALFGIRQYGEADGGDWLTGRNIKATVLMLTAMTTAIVGAVRAG